MNLKKLLLLYLSLCLLLPVYGQDSSLSKDEKIAILEEQIKSYRTDLQSALTEQSLLLKNLGELESLLDKQDQSTAELQGQLEDLKTQLAELNLIITQLGEKLEKSESELSLLKNDLIASQGLSDQLQNDIDNYDKEHKREIILAYVKGFGIGVVVTAVFKLVYDYFTN